MSDVVLVTDRYQRAIKRHTCWLCEGSIKPGQVYRVQFNSERARMYPSATAKICLRCDHNPNKLALREATQRGRFKRKHARA